MTFVEDVAKNNIFPIEAVESFSLVSSEAANYLMNDNWLYDQLFTIDGKWISRQRIAIDTSDGPEIFTYYEYKKAFNASDDCMLFAPAYQVKLKHEFLQERDIDFGDNIIVAGKWFIYLKEGLALMSPLYDNDSEIDVHGYAELTVDSRNFLFYSKFLLFGIENYDKFGPGYVVIDPCDNKQDLENNIKTFEDNWYKVILNNVTGQYVIIDGSKYGSR